MRPLSLAKRGIVEPTVSMAALLAGGRPAFHGTTSLQLEDYAREIVASVFPSIRLMADTVRKDAIDGYIDRIVDRDVPEAGQSLRRADPALAARLLGVRVAAEAAGARIRHLRTNRGEREIDLIVVRDDHRVVAVEIKLAQAVNDTDVRHLRWLHDTIGDDLLDAIIITTGQEAYRRTDGIGVVPAALLGL